MVPAALLEKAKAPTTTPKPSSTRCLARPRRGSSSFFVVHADHNFDPFDDSVREMLLREFDKFEDPNYFIHLAVNPPNDD